jgi:hypothetical protein
MLKAPSWIPGPPHVQNPRDERRIGPMSVPEEALRGGKQFRPLTSPLNLLQNSGLSCDVDGGLGPPQSQLHEPCKDRLQHPLALKVG